MFLWPYPLRLADFLRNVNNVVGLSARIMNPAQMNLTTKDISAQGWDEE